MCSQPQLLEFWRDVIDPTGIGMLAALIEHVQGI